jgi:hypothetical protein
MASELGNWGRSTLTHALISRNESHCSGIETDIRRIPPHLRGCSTGLDCNDQAIARGLSPL